MFKPATLSSKTLATLVVVSILCFCAQAKLVNAATIVVNSNVDTTADDGSCTLREAISATNNNTSSGATPGECISGDIAPVRDLINFNITATPSYTNNGQPGYTILPQSPLPPISDLLTINGYSQPGSMANTSIAPRPFNGTLLVEIDGSQSSGAGLAVDYADNVVKGLALNSFHGVGIAPGADRVVIRGNYIGVDPTGQIAKPNLGNGINRSATGSSSVDHVLIGGNSPEDRNIVSASQDSGITPNTDNDYWVVKGNYIGMAADGLTPLGNSQRYIGPGGMSIDNCSGTVVGGPEVGATNLISGNKNFGIFPDNNNGLTIQGNIVGPNWKGEPIPGLPQPGGIGLVGLNGAITNALIGGVEPGEGNIIAHNGGPGVVLPAISFVEPVHTFQSATNTILGNSIHNNSIGDLYGGGLAETGLGIDIWDFTMNEVYYPVIINGLGPSLNDTGDTDGGANGHINFPVLSGVTKSADQTHLTVQYSLDVAGSPTNSYRIEFFGNDEADPSGYGEGQTYLGSATTGTGPNQEVTLLLPRGYDVEGKYISATTTAIDESTPSGFSSTSEFSKVLLVKEQLAETGQDTSRIVMLSLAFITAGGAGLLSTKLFSRYRIV